MTSKIFNKGVNLLMKNGLLSTIFLSVIGVLGAILFIFMLER